MTVTTAASGTGPVSLRASAGCPGTDGADTSADTISAITGPAFDARRRSQLACAIVTSPSGAEPPHRPASRRDRIGEKNGRIR